MLPDLIDFALMPTHTLAFLGSLVSVLLPIIGIGAAVGGMAYSMSQKKPEMPAQPTRFNLPPAGGMGVERIKQAGPGAARQADPTAYQRRGRRALTIPKTSNLNVPGM